MIKRNFIKKLSILGVALSGALGLTLSSNAQNINYTFNQDEKNSWTAFYNRVKNQYDVSNDFDIYTLDERNDLFGKYNDLFNNNGSMNNGFNGIQIQKELNQNNLLIRIPVQIKTFYISIYTNSTNDFIFNNSYLDAVNEFSVKTANESPIYFNSASDMYINNILIRNGLYVYKVSYDSTLQTFVNNYGMSFVDGAYSFNVDGGLEFRLSKTNYDNTNLIINAYYEDDLERIYNDTLKYQTVGSDSYNKGYESGYSTGQSAGYNSGYTAGETAGYNNGLTVGYNQGQASVSNTNATIMGLFGAIANVPITILNNVMAPTLLGIPLITILLNFFSVLLILWLIKKLIR